MLAANQVLAQTINQAGTSATTFRATFFIMSILILLISISAFVFWIMMIVHAATHPIENRAIWVLLLIFTGIIGAIVYYFVVKRKFNSQMPSSPTAPPTP